MNEMKRMIVVLLSCVGLWVTGCKNDGMMPTTDATELASVAGAAARYSATTDSVTVGRCKGKLTEIAVADLPAAVASYINTNYAGATVKFAAADAGGKVVVAIVLTDGTAKGLLFDADGAFNSELKRHAHKAKLTKVEISALPAAVTTYISTSYAGAEIKQAGTNADGEYFVGILSDGKIKVLLFKADGTFNKELEKPAFAPGKPGKPMPGKR
jgi:hypothetical protein